MTERRCAAHLWNARTFAWPKSMILNRIVASSRSENNAAPVTACLADIAALGRCRAHADVVLLPCRSSAAGAAIPRSCRSVTAAAAAATAVACTCAGSLDAASMTLSTRRSRCLKPAQGYVSQQGCQIRPGQVTYCRLQLHSRLSQHRGGRAEAANGRDTARLHTQEQLSQSN